MTPHASARLQSPRRHVSRAVVFAAAVAIACGTGTGRRGARSPCWARPRPQKPVLPRRTARRRQDRPASRPRSARPRSPSSPPTAAGSSPGRSSSAPPRATAEATVQVLRATSSTASAAPRAALGAEADHEEDQGRASRSTSSSRRRPVEQLEPFFGTTTTFTLQDPLQGEEEPDRRADHPDLGTGLRGRPGRHTALAGEPRRRTAEVHRRRAPTSRPAAPSRRIGTDRAYGCVYKTARLLYSATIVKARPLMARKRRRREAELTAEIALRAGRRASAWPRRRSAPRRSSSARPSPANASCPTTASSRLA